MNESPHHSLTHSFSFIRSFPPEMFVPPTPSKMGIASGQWQTGTKTIRELRTNEWAFTIYMQFFVPQKMFSSGKTLLTVASCPPPKSPLHSSPRAPGHLCKKLGGLFWHIKLGKHFQKNMNHFQKNI